MSLIKSS